MTRHRLGEVENEISDSELPKLLPRGDNRKVVEDHAFIVPIRHCSHYLLAKERWHWESIIWQVVRENNDIIDVDNLRLTYEPSGYTATGAYEDTGIVGGVVLAAVDFSLASIQTAVLGPVLSVISVTSRFFGIRSRRKLEHRLLEIKQEIVPVHNRHRKVRVESFRRFDTASGYDPHRGA